ncbi:MAG: Gfo/Idh/MocA family oxidoreductase, partial [Leifsonia sp.]
MIQYLTGTTVDAVSGTLATFVPERPLPAPGESRGLGGAASSGRGAVTVDDAAWFTGRLSSGAIGSFQATRFATGRKNAFRFELSGSLGAIAFDMESMNELQFYDATAPAGERGFTRIIATEPEHPYAANWWPTGHALGYEHAFSHEAADFIDDIAAGRDPRPSFADGLQVQRVLAAIETSAGNDSAWTATT